MWLKRRKLFKKKLAQMMYEYENETKQRIENIERALTSKGIMTIYTIGKDGSLKTK